MTFEENAKIELDKQLKYCGIDKYHKQGYKGKDIVILNHEANTEHALMTTRVLKEVAPEATIINASVKTHIKNNVIQYHYYNIEGVDYTPEEMYIKYRPDIMSVSFIGSKTDELLEDILKPLIEKGLIICCAAGNEGSGGVKGKYKNIDITVGAVHFIDDYGQVPQRIFYSSFDIDKISVDFMGFLGSRGGGTSAATPFVAGQIALIMQKYGRMKQDKMKQLLIKCARDINMPGVDEATGYGIIIMPEGEIDMSDINLKFSDVSDTRWSKNSIDFCVREGMLKGYPDGTFRPEGTITREEFATIIHRILEKVGK